MVESSYLDFSTMVRLNAYTTIGNNDIQSYHSRKFWIRTFHQGATISSWNFWPVVHGITHLVHVDIHTFAILNNLTANKPTLPRSHWCYAVMLRCYTAVLHPTIHTCAQRCLQRCSDTPLCSSAAISRIVLSVISGAWALAWLVLLAKWLRKS